MLRGSCGAVLTLLLRGWCSTLHCLTADCAIGSIHETAPTLFQADPADLPTIDTVAVRLLRSGLDVHRLPCESWPGGDSVPIA